jgi:predicted acyltransferase
MSFGVLAGHWLRSSQTQNRKVLGLLGAGTTCILISLVWDKSFPIIFRLWSSSYAMLVIGISAILLALFFWLIDVRGYKKWAFPFVVVGMNSITIYFVQRFLISPLSSIYLCMVSGIPGFFPGCFHCSLRAYREMAVLYYLYKKNIFLKV